MQEEDEEEKEEEDDDEDEEEEEEEEAEEEEEEEGVPLPGKADAALRGSRREGRRSFAVGGGGGARSPAEEALVS